MAARAGGAGEPASETVPPGLLDALVRGLNAAAESHGDLYRPERFRFVPDMPPDLQATFGRALRGGAAVVRNRLLLQAAFRPLVLKADEQRFRSVAVPALARTLHRRTRLDDADFARMNRLLLQAAYPRVFLFDPGARAHLAAFADGLTLTSYRMVFRNRGIYVGYANTLFRTVTATFLVVLFTAIAAFPLARHNLPHRGALIVILLVTMVFSGGIIPSFLLIRSIGLYNSRWVYVIPTLLSAFNIILMKNFFQSLPESLYESAVIDGASEWRVLFQIYLPLSKPVLATIALWTAVAHWNEWYTPLVYIDDPRKQVLQYFLQRVVIDQQTDLIERGLLNPDTRTFTTETIKAATVMVTMLPILCVYPFIQKHFVKGVLLGSVKE